MIRQILVPLDGSRLAEGALAVASDVAESLPATLVLARVVPPAVPGRFYTPQLLDQLAEAQTKEAEAYLAAVAARLREDRLTVETRVLSGPVAASLVGEAERGGSDMIVINSHGAGGLAYRVFGSVAQKLLETAPCPVLVARSTKAQLDAEEEAEERGADRALLRELSPAGRKEA